MRNRVIGDAIYGVNDGPWRGVRHRVGYGRLHGRQRSRLAAGLAGTLASALSMAPAPTFVEIRARSIRVGSERARKSRKTPHEEVLELDLFYQLKGFSAEEARAMAERIQKKPKQFLRTMVHEELGLSEENFPKPWRSTVSATVSTAIGGFIPVIPFFFAVGMPAVVASFVISTVAHFAVGASKALVTTRPWWSSGIEMTVVGVLEAAITYGLGLAFAAR